MIQKDKDLVLQDLCVRLPYRPKIGFAESNSNDNLQSIWYDDLEGWQVDGNHLSTSIYAIKPYLFPLSSMTEEQIIEYCQLQQKVIYNSKGVVNEDVIKYVNWCYKNHLDINNLIPKGLAIDATGLNIYDLRV